MTGLLCSDCRLCPIHLNWTVEHRDSKCSFGMGTDLGIMALSMSLENVEETFAHLQVKSRPVALSAAARSTRLPTSILCAIVTLITRSSVHAICSVVVRSRGLVSEHITKADHYVYLSCIVATTIAEEMEC